MLKSPSSDILLLALAGLVLAKLISGVSLNCNKSTLFSHSVKVNHPRQWQLSVWVDCCKITDKIMDYCGHFWAVFTEISTNHRHRPARGLARKRHQFKKCFVVQSVSTYHFVIYANAE